VRADAATGAEAAVAPSAEITLAAGETWTSVGPTSALIGSVQAFAVSGSDLFVGGSGRASPLPGADLFVGGYFQNAAGIPEADLIARWDGTAWSALGSNGAGDGALRLPLLSPTSAPSRSRVQTSSWAATSRTSPGSPSPTSSRAGGPDATGLHPAFSPCLRRPRRGCRPYSPPGVDGSEHGKSVDARAPTPWNTGCSIATRSRSAGAPEPPVGPLVGPGCRSWVTPRSATTSLAPGTRADGPTGRLPRRDRSPDDPHAP
jgi:hypothetical protein